MDILFICKHNRFRSKVAEALFNKLIKKRRMKNIRAFSRGTELDKERMYIAPEVKRALRKFGVRKVDNEPRKLTKSMIKRADIIIIAADNADVKASGKRIIKWRISDTSQDNYKEILRRTKDIEKRVKKLVNLLK